MKRRNGFVSNSSSSSFVCEISGEIESGFDMGARELGLVMCEYGHTMLERYANYDIDSIPIEVKAKIVAGEECRVEWEIKDRVERNKKHAEDMLIYIAKTPESEIVSLFEEYADNFDELPRELCPLCTLKEVSADDALAYLLKVNTTSMSAIKKSMREKFSNYKELKDFLTEKE